MSISSFVFDDAVLPLITIVAFIAGYMAVLLTRTIMQKSLDQVMALVIASAKVGVMYYMALFLSNLVGNMFTILNRLGGIGLIHLFPACLWVVTLVIYIGCILYGIDIIAVPFISQERAQEMRSIFKKPVLVRIPYKFLIQRHQQTTTTS